MRKAFSTLYRSTRYSIEFSLHNAKTETIARIITAFLSTILVYVSFQAMGRLINATVSAVAQYGKGEHSFSEFMQSGIVASCVILAAVYLFDVVLGRFTWFYQSRWNQLLRFANRKEMDELRSSLDIARFKSSEFDTLDRNIKELPWGEQTRITFADELLRFVTTLFSFVIFGMSLLWYQPLYALVLLVTAIPMVIVEFKGGGMWWDIYQKMVPHHKKMEIPRSPYRNAKAFVQAQMFNQFPSLRREIDTGNDMVISEYDAVRNFSFRKEMPSHAFAVLGLCAVIFHAIYTTFAHGSSIGTLTIVIGAARTFQGNLERIVSLISEQWNTAKGVILIKEEYFAQKPVIETVNPVVPTFQTPTIVFEEVSFTYPKQDKPEKEKPALRNVNLRFEHGKKYAVVGESGSGKTTLARLLLRISDPTEGTITADGVSLTNIDPTIWRRYATALLQEYVISDRILGAEIASSRIQDPVDLDALWDAARIAHFDGVIRDESLGVDTQIGTEHGGKEFSGGQKQRLALTSVIYRGAPITILDEPDANLDPKSAQIVMQNIMSLPGTVIIITHHVSNAERCDHVIVMGKGEVLEEGHHSDLIDHDGAYSEMFRKDRERIGLVDMVS